MKSGRATAVCPHQRRQTWGLVAIAAKGGIPLARVKSEVRVSLEAKKKSVAINHNKSIKPKRFTGKVDIFKITT